MVAYSHIPSLTVPLFSFDMQLQLVGDTLAEIDLPSLLKALSFTANMSISFFDPTETMVPKETGLTILVLGSLFFVYLLPYLKSGFFGDSEPKLDYLVTKGPYRFCRHPQYLSFIIMIFGFDLMFRSVIGIVFTSTLSIPGTVIGTRVEDRLLRKKFGKEWENCAEHTGFLFPKFRKQ